MLFRLNTLVAAVQGALLLAIPVAHAADPAIIELPVVEVNATRLANPSTTQPDIEVATARAAQVAGGANVIDAERYQDARATTMEDVFRFSPGVIAQPRFGAEEARLSIRGSGLQRTFHLRGIYLLQDEVPLNQADGSGDFQSVEPLAARYVAVYRGANALEYGATSLGGAINFASATGFDMPTGVRAESGSFGYRRLQASAGGNDERLDGAISLSHFAQDGFRKHAVQDNNRLFANGALRISPELETRFFVTALKSESELPGNLTKAQLAADPTQANAGNVALNQQRNFDLYRLANKTSYALSDDSHLDIAAFYAEKSLFHPIFQVLDVDYRDYGGQLRYVSGAQLAGRDNRFTAGIVPTYGNAHDVRHANVRGQRGALTNESEQIASNLVVFAENAHFVRSDTELVVGAQWAQSKRRLEDRYFADGADNSFDVSYTQLNPKLGMRYLFSPDAQLFANWSRSFEPPSFGELAGGPRITQVAAQSGSTLELGSRGNAAGLQWDVALYRAAIDNELLSLNDGNGNPLGTVNAPHTLHQGIEAGLDWAVAPGWLLRQAYTFNDFRFDGHPVYGNNTLPGLPRQLYQAELRWNGPSGWFAGPNLSWSPQRYAVDMANTLYADPYAVWGLKLGQQREKGLSWFAEVKNIADKRYAATTGVIADARGRDAAQFLPGDGRSFYAGLSWKL
ncbi:Fe(3+) dicitrate transport protein FecA [Andreprevotia sp. IGB-42]|uniref:TonB-dependent receptor family protein n=1 Tax=Andreprevotia sp. IGB-42 TaxID=2497473 RepID=UPI00135888DC|nr:TonB-dependent receptor [Andreprevotia sp. IGB-42]KAF0813754.1 Fe(3+) dicitrate transport protein FecA [Andreprevotia sp. IGB-42]